MGGDDRADASAGDEKRAHAWVGGDDRAQSCVGGDDRAQSCVGDETGGVMAEPLGLGEARRPYEMGYAGTFAFPLAPEALWADVERFDRFDRWWRWLDGLEADGDGLVAGTVLRGVIAPPVPYRMRVEVRLVACHAPEHIDADVRGDLRGVARVRIRPTDSGSAVCIGWRLEMRQPTMRAAARLAYPLLRWGHDRVVAWTVEGYRRHLRSHPRGAGGPRGA